VRTTKISIAIDKEQLRRVRRAAKTEGLSVSAYVARALGNQLDDQQRVDAARAIHATWDQESVPTAKDREQFLARMAPKRIRRSRAA
jgi:hypothetical protein